MTGQRTPQMERGRIAPRELDSLLATGPFSVALRAAIRARGLGLERIQYRLKRRGVPVSLATLSHWQSGRCRPERPGSLAALRYLEEVLEVPDGALLRLLALEDRRQGVAHASQ
ncbi:transcriptional regulator [Prauserella oleivorans]|uniref:Transcriptional regulator n=1 Tax=Prauserella oleivorans TaxID=1478153 RepID=A0ABW5WII8_9PSEU